MAAFIEIIQLLAALTLTLAGLALVAGISGAARNLARWGFALLLLAFLLPTIMGLIQYAVGRTREVLPTFGSSGTIGWCTGGVIGIGHLSFGAWYLSREKRALARRAEFDETRRARSRERERLPPPVDPGGAA